MMTGNLITPKVMQGLFILLAVIAVAVADVLLKKATHHGNLGTALSSPWLFMAIGLYLLQIVIFTIAFVAGWKLSLIGALQTAIYAIIVLSAGLLLYNESLRPLQVIGVLLAFGGVVLINWP
jgi:multidrug transporter EmrE-like cation transporter